MDCPGNKLVPVIAYIMAAIRSRSLTCIFYLCLKILFETMLQEKKKNQCTEDCPVVEHLDCYKA